VAQSIKGMIRPADIAALAVFLASDARKSISGQVLPIDNDRQRAWGFRVPGLVARMKRSEIRGRPHGLVSRSRITLRSIRATIATASLFQLGDLLAAVLGVERVKDVIKWPMSPKRLAARARQ
jgi:hypothetical protein